MPKILIIAGNARSLIANRSHLISDFLESGHSVVAIVPSYDYLEEVEHLGIPIVKASLRRTAVNPFFDLKFLFEIYRVIKRIKPDKVFNYTIKPVIYGSIAARIARVKSIYSMITGLGYVYTTRSFKTVILKFIVSKLYKFALRANKRIFFQNPDDMVNFVSDGIVDQEKCVRIYGSGVDLNSFQPASIKGEPLVFLFVGRLLIEKGIREFCRAATLVKSKHPKVTFIAVGGHDESLPHSISARELSKLNSSGSVKFEGSVKDIRPHIARSHVLVLPSYREGTPRAVLEAMAMQRPIITTDAPGCRETVIQGENGFLVPIKDHVALARAIERFIETPEVIEVMGRESRNIAENLYDVRKVNKIIMDAMQL